MSFVTSHKYILDRPSDFRSVKQFLVDFRLGELILEFPITPRIRFRPPNIHVTELDTYLLISLIIADNRNRRKLIFSRLWYIKRYTVSNGFLFKNLYHNTAKLIGFTSVIA